MPAEYPTDVHDEQLLSLVDQLIERIRRGEHIDEEALLQEYPQYRRQFDEMFTTIKLLAELREPTLGCPSPPAGFAPAEVAGHQLGTVGDFQLVREIGRGGMGVVYEAQQQSLNRRVALKILPFASVLDARQLMRFKNEAQAAASLSHPHIVPVYGVGCERGVHYYAMQLIQGHTLAAMIQELRGHASQHEPAALANSSRATQHASLVVPSSEVVEEIAQAIDAYESPGQQQTQPVAAALISTDRAEKNSSYFRTVARLGIQAAQALHYAHEHGVIHRDVKPGNLMVDERGELWIADFGLAQLESNPNLTFSGDVIGTVRYMSPEQARVQPGVVDHRSDIYSLGVTLYELLTRRPAFSGETRHELLNKIGSQEPLNPTVLDRAIPRELATIVLKACRRMPEDRYASAAALADDLQRFLDHRPIHARPPTVLDRCGKWCHRNRPLVMAAACSMILAIVTLAVSNMMVAHQRDLARAASVREMHQAEQATREKTRANRNYYLALQTMNEMLHRVSGKQLKNVPMMQEVRIDLTQRAIDLLNQLDRQESSGQQIAYEIGRAHQQLAHLQRLLGRYESAEESARRAIAIFGRIATSPGASADVQQRLVETYKSLANIARDLGRLDDAIALCEQAETLAEELISSSGPLHPVRQELASCRTNRALALSERGSVDLAEACYVEALQSAAMLAEEDPTLENLHCLGIVQFNMGGLYVNQKSWGQAEPQLASAIATFAAILEQSPAEAEIREWLAMSHGNLGVLYQHTSRADEAAAAIREQINILADLSRDFPSVPVYRHEAAVGRGNLAAILRSTGDLQGAGDELAAAVTALQTLTQDFPEVTHYREHLADFEVNAGNLALSANEPVEAVRSYENSLRAYEQLSASFPERIDLRESLAIASARLGLAHQKAGNVEASEQYYRQAVDQYEALASLAGRPAEHHAAAAHILWQLGTDLFDRDALDESEKVLTLSLELLEKACSSAPERQALRARLAQHYGICASRFAQGIASTEKLEAAVRRLQRSLDIMQSLVSEVPGEEAYQNLLCASQCNLAAYLGDSGTEAEAWQLYQNALTGHALPDARNAAAWFLCTCSNPELRDPEAALSLARQAAEEMPDDGMMWNTRALAHYRLGELEESQRCLDKCISLGGASTPSSSVISALIAARSGQVEKSRHELEKAADAFESNPQDQSTAVRRLIDEAREQLQLASDAALHQSR